MNRLLFGDNLKWLRDTKVFPDASVIRCHKINFLSVQLISLFFLFTVVMLIMPTCYGSDAEAKATKSFLDGNWSQTVTNANRWVAEDPVNPVPHALLNIAHAGLEEIGVTINERKLAYGSKDNTKKVQEWASALVLSHGHNSSAYLLKGAAFENGGDKQTAADMYKKTTEVDPSFTQGLKWLGGLYLDSNQIDAALVIFSDMLNKHPNSSVAYDQVGMCYACKNDWQRAVQYFEKSVELNPKNIGGLHNLAIAYIQVGSIEKEKLVLQKMVELDPAGEFGQWARQKLLLLNK